MTLVWSEIRVVNSQRQRMRTYFAIYLPYTVVTCCPTSNEDALLPTNTPPTCDDTILNGTVTAWAVACVNAAVAFTIFFRKSMVYQRLMPVR